MQVGWAEYDESDELMLVVSDPGRGLEFVLTIVNCQINKLLKLSVGKWAG
jgi:hypothetical protein